LEPVSGGSNPAHSLGLKIYNIKSIRQLKTGKRSEGF
jgi:hypothetical protein